MTTPARAPAPMVLAILTGEDAAQSAIAHMTQSIGALVILHQPQRLASNISTPPEPAGCLCCTSQNELHATFERLLRDIDNARAERHDAIVVTTATEADAIRILATIGAHPYLSLRLRPALLLAAHNGASAPQTVADIIINAETTEAERLHSLLSTPPPERPAALRTRLLAAALDRQRRRG